MKKINNKKFLSIALVLTVLFSMFAVIVVETKAETKSKKQISAVDRIQADYKTKKITLDEYILNKAWAVFKPEKLSGTKYALSFQDVKVRKNGTSMILEIQENWDRLSPETQDILRCNILLRPDDGLGCEEGQGSISLPSSTSSTHFKVHYTITGANAVTADYADTILGYFEDSYGTEVTALGYLPPLSDGTRGGDAKYDVYIYDLGSGLYGYTCKEQWPAALSYSYIAVNVDYDWAPSNDEPLGDAIGAAKVTAAHEFFHAIQFGYDANEDVWWMETTATYMEDEVYPDVNDNYNYLPWFFEFSGGWGLEVYNEIHEYSNFIFAKFLSETFTDDVIKEIWVECETSDGLTAIDNVLVDTHSSTVIEEFNEFTKANFFLEDMYVDGAGYRAAVDGTWDPEFETTFDGVYLAYEYDAVTDGLPFTIDDDNVNAGAWMDQWATNYITLALDPAVANYWVSFNGLDDTTNYVVNLVTKKGAVITDHIFSLDAGKDGYVNLAYDTYDTAVLIIMNAGDTTTTDPSWTVLISTEDSILFDRDDYSAPDTAYVTVLDNELDITDDVDTVNVEFESDPTADTAVVTLIETGASTGVFTGFINLVVGVATANGILEVQHADTITVTYDNGGIPVTDTAIISLISAPTGLTATAGRTYVFLRWNPVSSSILQGYNVYRSTSLTGAKIKINGALVTSNDYQNIYLISGTTYYYWVTAVDIYDIDTDYSSPVMITTTTEGGDGGDGDGGDDGDGDGGDNGGGGGGGGGAGSLSGCFVATASYGTPMAEEVRVLSQFRDEYLMTNSLGRIFVEGYYRFSPQLAGYISKRPALKKVCKDGIETFGEFFGNVG